VNHLLRPLGFSVFEAGGGAAGLALADHCSPDLVLLDIQMPGTSGWDVAEQLRARFGPALRIVMVSANAHEFHAGRDGRRAHDAFLTKPVDLDALLDMIARQLSLDWIVDEAETVAAPRQAARALPPSAAPYLEELRRFMKLGHVRGIETTLVTLERNVPESADLVARLRPQLQAFDLRGLARTLDDVG
jgi:CheY-like chemotaxis protein